MFIFKYFELQNDKIYKKKKRMSSSVIPAGAQYVEIHPVMLIIAEIKKTNSWEEICFEH